MTGFPLRERKLDQSLGSLRKTHVAFRSGRRSQTPGVLKFEAGVKPRKEVSAKHLTRLQTVKQLFNSFANRSQAYNYASEIGLVTFGNAVNIVQPLTPFFESAVLVEPGTHCSPVVS